MYNRSSSSGPWFFNNSHCHIVTSRVNLCTSIYVLGATRVTPSSLSLSSLLLQVLLHQLLLQVLLHQLLLQVLLPRPVLLLLHLLFLNIWTVMLWLFGAEWNEAISPSFRVSIPVMYFFFVFFPSFLQNSSVCWNPNSPIKNIFQHEGKKKRSKSKKKRLNQAMSGGGRDGPQRVGKKLEKNKSLEKGKRRYVIIRGRIKNKKGPSSTLSTMPTTSALSFSLVTIAYFV